VPLTALAVVVGAAMFGLSRWGHNRRIRPVPLPPDGSPGGGAGVASDPGRNPDRKVTRAQEVPVQETLD
jgi:hypothetical protein